MLPLCSLKVKRPEDLQNLLNKTARAPNGNPSMLSKWRTKEVDVYTDGEKIEQVENNKYFVSWITEAGNCDEE